MGENALEDTTRVVSATVPERGSITVPLQTRRAVPIAAAAGAVIVLGAGAWFATRDSAPIVASDAGVAARAPIVDAGAVADGMVAAVDVNAIVDAGAPVDAVTSDAGVRDVKRAPLVKKRVDRAHVEAKLAKLQARAGNAKNPALDKLSAQIADDIAAERYVDANAKLDRALALVR
jgi:hypothetical protein